jgi:Spy/CpxP family protein refolding chaperone
MIQKKLAVILFPVLLLALAAPSAAQAQRTWAGAYTGGLNLTDEQLDQIQELRLAFQQALIPLSSKLRIAYVELDDLEMRGADQNKIEAKLQELDQLEAEMDEMYLAHQDQIGGLLTDEQRVLYESWGGLGLGWGPEAGLGLGYGRGMGRGAVGRLGLGYGRGVVGAPGLGYGRGVVGRPGLGYGRGVVGRPGLRYGRGAVGTLGLGYGRGYARGMGRGYYCPYNLRTGRSSRLWRRRR